MHAALIEAPHPQALVLKGILFQLSPLQLRTLMDLPVVLPGALPLILFQQSLYFFPSSTPYFSMPTCFSFTARIASAVAMCMTVSSLYLQAISISKYKGPFWFVSFIISSWSILLLVRNSHWPFLQPIASPTPAKTMQARQFSFLSLFSVFTSSPSAFIVKCKEFTGYVSILDENRSNRKQIL